MGLTSGYHTGAVMASKGSLVHAKRITQARGVRIILQASYTRPDGHPSHAYLQVDGEPWVQDVPSDKDTQPIMVSAEAWATRVGCDGGVLAMHVTASAPVLYSTGGMGSTNVLEMPALPGQFSMMVYWLGHTMHQKTYILMFQPAYHIVVVRYWLMHQLPLTGRPTVECSNQMTDISYYMSTS